MYTNRSYMKKPDPASVDIADCPADTISDIAFNLENSAMAVSSWDATLSLYTFSFMPSFGSAQPFRREKVFPLPAPALSTAFFGSTVVAGCVTGALVCFDMNGNQNLIQAHSAGIKAIKNYNNQFLITGSFDSTIKFWDLKSSQPIYSISLPGKVYAMSLSGSLLCVACSSKAVLLYDINNLNAPSTYATRFNYGIRSVAMSSDLDTFVAGGLEAKIEVFSKTMDAKKFCVRSHRDNSRLYSVNVLHFYPLDAGVIVSGGADGSLVWFDKHNRMKIQTFSYTEPITAAQFTADGRYFVFATGEDWSKGYVADSPRPSLKFLDAKNISGLNK